MTLDEERDEFIRRVVAASPIQEDRANLFALILWFFAGESEKLAKASCNRELTKREIKRDAELDVIVEKIGKELGLKAYRQDDPRGNTIRVVVGPEFTDNWDGESVGCG